MPNLTGPGLTCFAAAAVLAFAVPVNWTFAVPLPCVFPGLAFLAWDEVHAPAEEAEAAPKIQLTGAAANGG